MTTTYYASTTSDTASLADLTGGTSSTAGDLLELRMGNGTTVPNRRQCIEFLELCKRWIMQGGTDGAGVNLPPTFG